MRTEAGRAVYPWPSEWRNHGLIARQGDCEWPIIRTKPDFERPNVRGLPCVAVVRGDEIELWPVPYGEYALLRE